MPTGNTRRIVPFVLALTLVLVPASFAAASPVAFDAPAVQTVDQGGFFSWITGWFQDLFSVSDSAAAQAGGPVDPGVDPAQPTSDLSGDSTEEEDRGPQITVTG